MVSIVSQYGRCIHKFNSLILALQSDELDSERARSNLAGVEDEVGRLRIWAAQEGAHRSGKPSLDHHLREAPHVHKRVTELLNELYEDLEKVVEIATCGKSSELWEISLGAQASVFDQKFEDGNDQKLERVLKDIAHIITLLYSLSMVIRNPAPREQVEKLPAIDVSHFESLDISKLRSRFPHAQEYLIKRLVAANCKRRQLLVYYKSLRHSAKPEAISIDEGDSDGEVRSQTSYATSLNDYVDGCIEPDFENASHGKPVQCSYCYQTIKINNQRSWRKHVLRDLRPYSCIYRDCPESDKIYASQQEWFAHEIAVHRREWTCDGDEYACAPQTFDKAAFMAHLRTFHGFSSEIEIEAIMVRHERAKLSTEDCTLCSRALFADEFKKHIVPHLIKAALSVLPSRAQDHDGSHAPGALGQYEKSPDSEFEPHEEEEDEEKDPELIPEFEFQSADELETGGQASRAPKSAVDQQLQSAGGQSNDQDSFSISSASAPSAALYEEFESTRERELFEWQNFLPQRRHEDVISRVDRLFEVERPQSERFHNQSTLAGISEPPSRSHESVFQSRRPPDSSRVHIQNWIDGIPFMSNQDF